MDITEHLTTFLTSVTEDPKNNETHVETLLKTVNNSPSVLFEMLLSNPIIAYTDDDFLSLHDMLCETYNITDETEKSLGLETKYDKTAEKMKDMDINDIIDFDQVEEEEEGYDDDQKDDLEVKPEDIIKTKAQIESLITNIKNEQYLLITLLTKVITALTQSFIGRQLLISQSSYILLLCGNESCQNYFRRINNDNNNNNNTNGDNNNNNDNKSNEITFDDASTTHTITSLILPTDNDSTGLFLSEFFDNSSNTNNNTSSTITISTHNLKQIDASNKINDSNRDDNAIPQTSTTINTSSNHAISLSKSMFVQTIVNTILNSYITSLQHNVQQLLTIPKQKEGEENDNDEDDDEDDDDDDKESLRLYKFNENFIRMLNILLQSNNIDIELLSNLYGYYTIYIMLNNIVNNNNNILNNTIFDTQYDKSFLSIYINLDLNNDNRSNIDFDDKNAGNILFLPYMLILLNKKDDINNIDNNQNAPTSYQAILQYINNDTVLFTRYIHIYLTVIHLLGYYYEKEYNNNSIKEKKIQNVINQQNLSKMIYIYFSTLNNIEFIEKINNIVLFPQLLFYNNSNNKNNKNDNTNNSNQSIDIILSLTIFELIITLLSKNILSLYYLQSTNIIYNVLYCIFYHFKILRKPLNILQRTTTTNEDEYFLYDIYSTFNDYYNADSQSFFDEEDENIIFHELLLNKTNQTTITSKINLALQYSHNINEFFIYTNNIFKHLAELVDKNILYNIDNNLFFFNANLNNNNSIKQYIDKNIITLNKIYNTTAVSTINTSQFNFNYHYHCLSLTIDSSKNIIHLNDPNNTNNQDDNENKNDNDNENNIDYILQKYYTSNNNKSLKYIFFRGLSVLLKFSTLFSSISTFISHYGQQHFTSSLYPYIYHQDYNDMNDNENHQIIDETLEHFKKSYEILNKTVMNLYLMVNNNTNTLNIKYKKNISSNKNILHLLLFSPIGMLLTLYHNYHDDVKSHIINCLSILFNNNNRHYIYFNSRYNDYNNDNITGNTPPQTTILYTTGFPSLPLVFNEDNNNQNDKNDKKIIDIITLTNNHPNNPQTYVNTDQKNPLTHLNTINILSLYHSYCLTMLINPNQMNFLSFLNILPIYRIITAKTITPVDNDNNNDDDENNKSKDILKITNLIQYTNTTQWGSGQQYCSCGHYYHHNDGDDNDNTKIFLPTSILINDNNNNFLPTKDNNSAVLSYHKHLYNNIMLKTLTGNDENNNIDNNNNRNIINIKQPTTLQTLLTTIPLTINDIVNNTKSVLDNIQFNSLHLLLILSSNISSKYYTLYNTVEYMSDNKEQHNSNTHNNILNIDNTWSKQYLYQNITFLKRLIDNNYLTSDETTKLIYDWKHKIAQNLLFIFDHTKQNNNTTLSLQKKIRSDFFKHVVNSCNGMFESNWSKTLPLPADSNGDAMDFGSDVDQSIETKKESSNQNDNDAMTDQGEDINNNPNDDDDDDDDDDGYGGYYTKRYKEEKRLNETQNTCDENRNIIISQSSNQNTNNNNNNENKIIKFKPDLFNCSYYQFNKKHTLSYGSSFMAENDENNYQFILKTIEKFSRTLHMLPPKQDSSTRADVAQ